MKFINPIPFVSDVERSKRFYRDILGLEVVADLGDFVQFAGGFAIHDGAALQQTVWGTAQKGDTAYGRANLLLYFEDDDVDGAYARLADDVDIIHPVRREPWGQRVFRFLDPDGH
ncbi:MAG: VOC family protein, partial [Pseudomonadota bacterium]